MMASLRELGQESGGYEDTLAGDPLDVDRDAGGLLEFGAGDATLALPTPEIAAYLRGHAKVAWVNYAGLPDHPDHPLVQKYMDGKASGILTFGVKGDGCSGSEAGARFQDALQLFTRLVNIGDAKSLACHPASTTHRQLAPAELAKAGVSEEMVRLSIGIEHVDDLINDLEQALAA